jgi:hypothetical protein
VGPPGPTGATGATGAPGPQGPVGPPGTGGSTTSLSVYTSQPSGSVVALNELIAFWVPNGPALDILFRAPTGQLYQATFGILGPLQG